MENSPNKPSTKEKKRREILISEYIEKSLALWRK